MAKNYELENLLREAGIESGIDKLQLQICNLQILYVCVENRFKQFC